MQPADLALIPIIIGAVTIGIAFGRALQHHKDSTMANSSDALKAAVADALATSKAKDDQIATLTAELASTQTQLTATQADLAADEQAIADSVAQLKPAAPAAA